MKSYCPFLSVEETMSVLGSMQYIERESLVSSLIECLSPGTWPNKRSRTGSDRQTRDRDRPPQGGATSRSLRASLRVLHPRFWRSKSCSKITRNCESSLFGVVVKVLLYGFGTIVKFAYKEFKNHTNPVKKCPCMFHVSLISRYSINYIHIFYHIYLSYWIKQKEQIVFFYSNEFLVSFWGSNSWLKSQGSS